MLENQTQISKLFISYTCFEIYDKNKYLVIVVICLIFLLSDFRSFNFDVNH